VLPIGGLTPVLIGVGVVFGVAVGVGVADF
jgi:hypothetical protein